MLPAGISQGQPLTALAPMQAVTSRPFMNVLATYGAPDYFFTEYFRVHATSRLEPDILQSITANTTGRPIFAQLIGEDLLALERIAQELQNYPIAGIDLNMGCPAPKIYRKNVGGGLLRDPQRVDEIFTCLRACTPGLFTVKMRIGFDSTANFIPLLSLINKHAIDLLSLHGRTVKEMYRSEVHYDCIQQAVDYAHCPVLANGNISSYAKAAWAIKTTGARGVMIGRSAIRNPWIFRQCREYFAEKPVFQPTLGDVRTYIERLYQAIWHDHIPEKSHVARMKKFLNFVGQSVDPQGDFLKKMRRAQTERELFNICDHFLMQIPQQPFALEPYAGVIARPNCETPLAKSITPNYCVAK